MPRPAPLELQRLGIKTIVRSDEESDGSHAGMGQLGAAGGLVGDGIVCQHVTDTPERVERRLEAGEPLLTGRDEGKFGDLGAGLYCSEAPQIWMGRASAKWRFLDGLDEAQRKKLRDAILATQQFTSPGYLTQTEKERATDYLDRYVRDPRYSWAVGEVADQPYNVASWRPAFLKPLGIEPGIQPFVVPMEVCGQFGEVDHRPSIEDLELLQQHSGLTGLFSPGGFSRAPQLVVWKNEAVKKFGNYVNPLPQCTRELEKPITTSFIEIAREEVGKGGR